MHHGQKKEKVLSSEEAEACMDRLYNRAMDDARRREEKRKATLAAVPGRLPPKHLSAAEVENLTQRMYDKQIEHQRIKREQNEKKREKEVQVQNRALSEEELADSVSRMYTQQRESQARKLEKLRRQFHPEPEKKTLTKDQIAAMGNRLCNEFLEKKAEHKQKIFERDIAPMDAKSHKITPEEMQEMANRLCTTKPTH